MSRVIEKLPALTNQYFFMRHGQTALNARKICIGQLDPPLDTMGIEQANTARLPYFSAQPVIYCSPLRRAGQTAEIVGRNLGVDAIYVDDRLIERHGGELQGWNYDQICALYQDLWLPPLTQDLDEAINTPFPGGQTQRIVILNLAGLILEVEAQYQNQQILAVAHSGTIQAARYLRGETLAQIYYEPTPHCVVEKY